MKRVQINDDIIERLSKGLDVWLSLSPKRCLAIGTMSDKDIKAECLKRKYEADLAKLATSGEDEW